jgi:hypothetical protein
MTLPNLASLVKKAAPPAHRPYDAAEQRIALAQHRRLTDQTMPPKKGAWNSIAWSYYYDVTIFRRVYAGIECLKNLISKTKN